MATAASARAPISVGVATVMAGSYERGMAAARTSLLLGAVAELVERHDGIVEVARSSRVSSTAQGDDDTHRRIPPAAGSEIRGSRGPHSGREHRTPSVD